ncbi:MAG: efflux RND transporter periplasmic adaptor subunit, partial [Prevotella sp.]
MRLLFVGTSLLAIVSCRQDNRQAPADDVISVTAEVVRPDSGDSRFIVSGDIEGQKTVKTAFQVAGRISGTVGEEGCMVRKGETIAWLDPTNYAIAKELADIMVAQAADEYSRVSILHERNSVSESDFMKCKYALDNAKGQQKLRAKDLADTRLQAPIGGILLQKMGETGEMAAAGMPVADISDISRVKINAYIPENRLRDIKIGQPVEVRIDAIGAVRKGSISEGGGV